jgi:hypothetical protein
VTGTGRAQLRSRLSYANVTVSLALFVALGGTAVAAVTLPRDSGISLSAVVRKRAGNPTIALRCTRQNHTPGMFLERVDRVAPTHTKIVALEVGSVTGP